MPIPYKLIYLYDLMVIYPCGCLGWCSVWMGLEKYQLLLIFVWDISRKDYIQCSYDFTYLQIGMYKFMEQVVPYLCFFMLLFLAYLYIQKWYRSELLLLLLVFILYLYVLTVPVNEAKESVIVRDYSEEVWGEDKMLVSSAEGVYKKKYNKVIYALPEIDTMIDQNKDLKAHFTSMLTANGTWKDGMKGLISLAVEFWKIKKKLLPVMDMDSLRWLSFILEKSEKILSSNKIELLDYEWEKYLEWISWISVISKEVNENMDHPIIHTTVEPWILMDWKLLKPSKVVVMMNE